MRVIVHPEARAELRAASLWYEERSVVRRAGKALEDVARGDLRLISSWKANKRQGLRYEKGRR